jgi:hypothetical protein
LARSAAEGFRVGNGWQNQWGVMRLADFRARKTLREVSASDLPVGGDRSAAAFREALTEFRQRLQPGDVLYHYDSDPEEWAMGFGSAGYAIVRDGELFDTLIVMMN